MRSFWAPFAKQLYHANIHPALTSFADECCATLARLIAYVGALVLLATVGLHLWDELALAVPVEPVSQADWSVASRSRPAFAVVSTDPSLKTDTYEIFRHPEGGRKDVLRWIGPSEKAIAELEIYRPGGELNPSETTDADIAARIASERIREVEAAGVIESKFGTVTLFRPTGGTDGLKSCLGFIKRLNEPVLRISGWSCQGETAPGQRAAIGCMLSRLILLTSGNEPKLAELFARAELKRGNCASATPSIVSADWVTGSENPRLRGPL
jgi:hypothetical protein